MIEGLTYKVLHLRCTCLQKLYLAQSYAISRDAIDEV